MIYTRTEGARVETWDTATPAGRYTRSVDGKVTDDRPFRTAELAWAAVAASTSQRLATAAQLRADIAAGVAQVQAARDAASADIATAQALQTSTLTFKGTVTARKTAVAASTPTATLAYVTALRDELVTVYGFLEQATQALADIDGYRAAVDRNALVTDDALLGLARLTG